jgi:hypothetical protein
MYCVFPRLYEGFPAYSPHLYIYIYSGLWPPGNTSCIFLTWYQSYRSFFRTRNSCTLRSNPTAPAPSLFFRPSLLLQRFPTFVGLLPVSRRPATFSAAPRLILPPAAGSAAPVRFPAPASSFGLGRRCLRSAAPCASPAGRAALCPAACLAPAPVARCVPPAWPLLPSPDA